MTGLGVALGAAAVVATIGLADTIRYQVSDEFDSRRATQIEVRSSDTEEPTTADGATTEARFPPAEMTLERVGALSGVDGVAVVRETTAEHRVAPNQVVDPTAIPQQARIYGVDAAGLAALDTQIRGPGWGPWHDQHQSRVAILSHNAANQLGAQGVDLGDTLFIDGISFTVVGILDESRRLPALTGGIVIPASTSTMFPLETERDRLVVTTQPGAARPVANILPVAVDPSHPDNWIAYAPDDTATLRNAVDDQLQALALGLGAIVLFLGAVSISNATLTSVLQRVHEVGLRRALGARPRHIAAHILLDAAILGALGGLAGVAVGVTAVLAVTATQGWVPVLDPRIPVLTILGALTAGTLAGIYPARIGSRLQPTEALRRE